MKGKKTDSGSGTMLKTAAAGVAGVAAGVAVGAAVAAMSNEKNRQKVMNFASQAKEKGMEILDAVADQRDEVEKQVKGKVAEIESKGQTSAHTAKK